MKIKVWEFNWHFGFYATFDLAKLTLGGTVESFYYSHYYFKSEFALFFLTLSDCCRTTFFSNTWSYVVLTSVFIGIHPTINTTVRLGSVNTLFSFLCLQWIPMKTSHKTWIIMFLLNYLDGTPICGCNNVIFTPFSATSTQTHTHTPSELTWVRQRIQADWFRFLNTTFWTDKKK